MIKRLSKLNRNYAQFSKREVIDWLKNINEELVSKQSSDFYWIRRVFEQSSNFLSKTQPISVSLNEHQVKRANTLLDAIRGFNSVEEKYFELCLSFFKQQKNLGEDEELHNNKLKLIGFFKRRNPPGQ